MPYAVVRSQFVENLQVTAPYGEGWTLLAWWPFPPSRICSTVKMPSLCCFLQKLLHFLLVRGNGMSFQLLVRHSKKGRNSPFTCSMTVLSFSSQTSYLYIYISQYLYIYISQQHHRLSFGSSLSQVEKEWQIVLGLSITGRVCSSSSCNRSMLLKSISIHSFV